MFNQQFYFTESIRNLNEKTIMDSEKSAVAEDDFCRKFVNSNKIDYQELKWLDMEKRIAGLVNRLKVSNIRFVADELIATQNLIAGRGVFCRSVMELQARSPGSSDVFAALVSIINSQFPDVGLLLVKRLILKFKHDFDRKNKHRMQGSARFLAQLVNQAVVYEALAVDILLLLLGNPSSDNVEVAVNFCVQCGSLLLDFEPYKLGEIFEEFRRVLRRGDLEKRVQVMIVKLFAARKSKFEGYPGVIDELELVGVEDQVTHDVSLLHDISPESSVDEISSHYEDDEVSSGVCH